MTQDEMITRTQFEKILTKGNFVKVESKGCCNVMRFHQDNGDVYEIESVTEHPGVPSMVFYKKAKAA
jgi:hypothetical protein